MNVLFLSPAFPPQHWNFCRALKERGVRVLGIGDTPASELRPELREALTDYVRVDLEDGEKVVEAVGALVERHGRIDRLDSHLEHWLPLEARLRERFEVVGLRPLETALQRSKQGMATLFSAAGIPHPLEQSVTGARQLRRFAEVHGYPLILKPDVGVGAMRTFRIDDAAQLESAIDAALEGYIVQPFIQGSITTYDGLVDREGRIVFATSHRYDRGMMEVLSGSLDGYYWSRREIPPALEAIGREAVAAFSIRERFFHAEFFELASGSYLALEMNLRPPGGFTTDMMNYACDIDVYRLWAEMVSGADVSGFRYERRYHAAHAGRRNDRAYRIPHGELVQRLGSTLVLSQPVPPIFATSMGDTMYLLRHEDEAALLEAIAWVQSPS